MELGIINSGESRRDEVDAQLLWTAVIIFPFANITGYIGHRLDVYHKFDSFNETDRFDTYFNALEKNKNYTPVQIKDIRKLYESMLYYRNKKGKSKAEIVLMKKIERLMNKHLSNYKTHFAELCELLKLTELLPLSLYNSKSTRLPLFAWYFPDERSKNGINERIRVMAKMVTQKDDDFLFFDVEIKTHNSSADVSFIEQAGIGTVFLSDFLFQIPAPETLNTQQIVVIRNELSKTFYPLLSNFESLFSILRELPFEQKEFSKIAIEYKNKIDSIKGFFQNELDKNELLNQLKEKNIADNTNTFYKVFAGISSFQNILNFYHQLKVIDEQNFLYITEEMSTKVNVKNSRLFFFMEKSS